MPKKFSRSPNIVRGGKVYYYNYRESSDGFHVSNIYFYHEGKKDSKIRIGKSFPVPFSNAISMRREMIQFIDSHSAKELDNSISFDKNMTFAEFFARTKAIITNDKMWKEGAASTKYHNIAAIENQIIPKIGDKPIKDITAGDCLDTVRQCEQEYKDRVKSGYKSNRAQKLLSLISTVLDYAKAYRLIQDNPLSRLTKNSRNSMLFQRVKTTRLKPKSISIPKLREILNIIEETVEANSEFLVFALMAGLGLRNYAAEGLRFCDIIEAPDHSMRSARIVMQSTNERITVIGAKNKHSYRQIPVLPEIWRIIEKRFDYIKRTYPDKPESELKLLTIACKGNDINIPCNNADTDRAVKKLFKKADLKENLLIPITPRMRRAGVSENDSTSYLFRRNFSSMLFDLAGLEEQEAMYLMGHSRYKVNDGQNIKFNSWERQFKLYEKMLRISAFLDDKIRPEVLTLEQGAPSAYVEDSTVTCIRAYMRKGESLKIQVRSREPYDTLSLGVNGNGKLDADLHTINRDYGMRAANLTGCISSPVIIPYPATGPTCPHPSASTHIVNALPAPGNREEEDDMASYDEFDDEDFYDESQEDEAEYWAWLEEMLGEEKAKTLRNNEYWSGPPKEENPPPVLPEEALESEVFHCWALDRSPNTQDSPAIVILTASGCLFRLGEELIPRQKPNTRGKRMMDVRLMGMPVGMLLSDAGSDQHIMAVTDSGYRYRIELGDIPCVGNEDELKEFLYSLRTEFKRRFCPNEEKITCIVDYPQDPTSETKLVLATDKGKIAKLDHETVFSTNMRKKVIKLSDGERVVGGVFCTNTDVVMLAASDSYVLPLKVNDLPERKTVSMGVNGILLNNGAECIGVVRQGELLTTISQSGHGKSTEIHHYHPKDNPNLTSKRGCMGKNSNKLASGEKLSVMLTTGKGYLYLASSDGHMLKLDAGAIPVSGYMAAGNRLMKPDTMGWVSCGTWEYGY